MLTINNKKQTKAVRMVTGSYDGTGEDVTLLIGFVPLFLIICNDYGDTWKWGWIMNWKTFSTGHTSGKTYVRNLIHQYLGKELEANPNRIGEDYAEPYVSGDDEAGVIIRKNDGSANGPNILGRTYYFWAFG